MSGEMMKDRDPGGRPERADDGVEDDHCFAAAGRAFAEGSSKDVRRTGEERGGDEDQQVDPVEADVDLADAGAAR
jgi:hypothetical protein